MITESDDSWSRKQGLLESLREEIGEDSYRDLVKHFGAARIVEMMEHLRWNLGYDAFGDLLLEEGAAEVFASALLQTISDLERERQARTHPESQAGPNLADHDEGEDWRRAINGFYPFLSWKSPVYVPLGEQVRRASVQPLKPLFDSIYGMVQRFCFGLNRRFPGLLMEPPHRGGWLLRQTPRVLVCMPFDSEQPEIAYRLVVKPVVENFFGGKCVRLTHPTVSDWRRVLRRELLYNHLAVFDLSFENENVRLEKEYYDTLARSLVEKSHICISYMWDRPQLDLERRRFRPKVSNDCLFYDCSDEDLVDFAGHLIQRLCSKLISLGFRKGTMDPWVIYPQPPPAGSDFRTIDTAKQARDLERNWVENIRIEHPELDFGSEPTSLQTIHSRDRELNTGESLFPVSVTLEGYPARASFGDVLDAFAETWRMANNILSREFGDNWCVPPNLDNVIDASISESHTVTELHRSEGDGHVMIQGGKIALMLRVKNEIGREFSNQKAIIECFHRCWCKTVGIPFKSPELQKLTIRLRKDGSLEVTSTDETVLTEKQPNVESTDTHLGAPDFHRQRVQSLEDESPNAAVSSVQGPTRLEQLLVEEGVEMWNQWRRENPEVRPDLRGAILQGEVLCDANLRDANLGRALLRGASLFQADLSGATLSFANLSRAELSEANLTAAVLTDAYLMRADLSRADLTRADLTSANLELAVLNKSILCEVILRNANLNSVDLQEADLTGADLTGADMRKAWLTDANLDRATLRRIVLTKEDDSDVFGSFLELATAKNLSSAIFDSPEFLQAYLEEALQYAQRTDIEEARQAPEWLEKALGKITTLYELYEGSEPLLKG